MIEGNFEPHRGQHSGQHKRRTRWSLLQEPERRLRSAPRGLSSNAQRVVAQHTERLPMQAKKHCGVPGKLPNGPLSPTQQEWRRTVD